MAGSRWAGSPTSGRGTTTDGTDGKAIWLGHRLQVSPFIQATFDPVCDGDTEERQEKSDRF